MEKADVARELIGHFEDGLEAPTAVDTLLQNFGDEKTAAKLIRRAKHRQRPLAWHIWNFAARVTAIIVGIYAVLILRLCFGRPAPGVDYIARMNAPILATPMEDRAWPLWRKAILASSDGAGPNHNLIFSEALDIRGPFPEPQTIKWLDQHKTALDLARLAASRPVLGFVYGPGGSAKDPELMMSDELYSPTPHLPMLNVPLAHLNLLRQMASLLAFDIYHAADLHDRDRADADFAALIGLSRQIRESDGMLVTELDSLDIDDLTVITLQHVLTDHADVLSDRQLNRLAHSLAGPQVAGDVMTFASERYFFEDFVQRMYTDDGHGDGRITFWGARMLPLLISSTVPNTPPPNTVAAAIALPLMASRAAMMEKYNEWMDQSRANFRLPIRNANWEHLTSQVKSVKDSPAKAVEYPLIALLFPMLSACQESCEWYLGDRDGTLVAIALELYHRRHGEYPATLAQLTPDLLPEIPADRITGDPVKYRVVSGKPIVYSVGIDRVDDGGIRAGAGFTNDPHHAAQWGQKVTTNMKGDWVLYPSVPPTAQ